MKPISVKKRTIKTPPGERALTAAIYILLGAFSLSTLYPFVNIIAKAFSGYTPNVTGAVGLWPMEFQTGTFMRVLTNPQFFTSFWVSLRVTVLDTGLSLFFSSLAGYVLSRERLKGRSFLTACFVFTMMFSGGMIPNYILVRSLHMLDTLWALFLPNVINVYNMLIIKTAFEGTPPALEESAKVDGASNFRIFYSIMFPMIAPSVAAVSLFLAVGYWNEYWSAIMYITKNALKPIQLYLLDVVNYASDPLSGTESTFDFQDAPEGIKSATIIVATLPILALYPFVQKYFVKGVMIGSVKE